MDIEFSGGDEISQPYLITSEGEVADLSGCTVTAEIWWRERLRLTLAVGSGLTFSLPSPPIADAEEDQLAHGTITLSELQTDTFPDGRIAFLRFIVVSSGGVTMSTERAYFDREI